MYALLPDTAIMLMDKHSRTPSRHVSSPGARQSTGPEVDGGTRYEEMVQISLCLDAVITDDERVCWR